MEGWTMLERLTQQIERGVITTLLLLMLLVVVLASVELVVVIAQEMMNPPRYLLLNIEELFPIFGFFLMILIGLELVETIRFYTKEHTLKAEFVLVVALIAVARKVIVYDFKGDSIGVIGVAALVLALCVGYFLLKRAHSRDTE
jgi:uncharacterized membrane protein (DUF373 family)